MAFDFLPIASGSGPTPRSIESHGTSRRARLSRQQELKDAGWQSPAALRSTGLCHALLGLERARVGGERDHVVPGQFGDDLPHQLGSAASARAVLDVIELADEVQEITVCDRWHLADAFEARAAPDGARNRLAAAAGRGQRLAFLDRAGGHVMLETGPRIAGFCSMLVLRQGDDAHADRLRAGAGAFGDETHGALADKALRHHG